MVEARNLGSKLIVQAFILLGSSATVSYTHLDVYKRQIYISFEAALKEEVKKKKILKKKTEREKSAGDNYNCRFFMR